MGAVVLFGAEKGGVGKSLLSCNLAAWAAKRGARVVLLDADPQATSANWATRRAENLLALDPAPAPVSCVQRTGKGVRETALDQARHADLVVIDAGGRDSQELRFALTSANVVYVPLMPAQADLETLPKVVSLIEAARTVNDGLIARAIKSNVPTVSARFGEVEDADSVFEQFAAQLPVSRVTVASRKAFRDSFQSGLGVVEWTNPAAQESIDQLGAELEELLGVEIKGGE